MQHVILSILDKKVDAFGRPFAARTNNEAVRIVSQEANRVAPDNMLNTNAEDFALYAIGTWDDETGHIQGNIKPERIIEVEILIKRTPAL